MLASIHLDTACENTHKQDVEINNKEESFSQEEVLAEGKCGEWPSSNTCLESCGLKRSYINTNRCTKHISKAKSASQEAMRTALNFPRFFITNLHNQNDDSDTAPLTYAEIMAHHLQCKKLIPIQYKGTNVLFRCGTYLGRDFRFALCAECDRVSRFHFDSWLWKQGMNQAKLKTFMRLCPKLKNQKKQLTPEQGAQLIWKSPNDYLKYFPVEKYHTDKFTDFDKYDSSEEEDES